MLKFYNCTLIFILFFFISHTPLQAEYKERLTSYKCNYLIAGNEDDQIMVQASFKYNILDLNSYGILYGGYTQKMYWEFYKFSNPFSDISFNPELFYRLSFQSSPVFDYIQISPIEHKSNGRDGDDNRSTNFQYIQSQVSYGGMNEVGLNVKVRRFIKVHPDNKDLDEYIGYYEATVFFKATQTPYYTMKEEFYYKWCTGKNNYGFDYDKGWHEVGFMFNPAVELIEASFYTQFRMGYTETLLDYNKKDWSIRAGIILQ